MTQVLHIIASLFLYHNPILTSVSSVPLLATIPISHQSPLHSSVLSPPPFTSRPLYPQSGVLCPLPPPSSTLFHNSVFTSPSNPSFTQQCPLPSSTAPFPAVVSSASLTPPLSHYSCVQLCPPFTLQLCAALPPLLITALCSSHRPSHHGALQFCPPPSHHRPLQLCPPSHHRPLQLWPPLTPQTPCSSAGQAGAGAAKVNIS